MGLYNYTKIPAAASVSGRRKNHAHKQDNPALVIGGVAGIFGVGSPHTAALVGLPADGAASGDKVLGSNLCGLLGLGVADFVVEHFDYLSFSCALIIAHFVGFVKG